MTLADTRMTRELGIRLPVIGGAMYPCSNPELVAAVSASGGIGVVQPVSLTFVHGHDFREGLRLIRRLTDRPIGMNALIESSSRIYRERMERWIDIALEEGVRFFVTSLGNPRWVVDRAGQARARVYHDVTQRKWADKAMQGGVHGLIAVNSRAGGHAGPRPAQQLFDELAPLGLPLVCAGGVSDADDLIDALRIGYDGVQLGTRFIATTECTASEAYKRAIVEADEHDIVLSERITGVPLAVIRTPYVDRVGTKAGAFARWMLRGRRTKHWMRSFYAVRSAIQLRRASLDPNATQDFWQAGRSVHAIDDVKPVAQVMREFEAALRADITGADHGPQS
ncbi:MAG: NAD(P)H-dependent flavin oxidoreductase [Longimicrobiales bacterium]